MYYILLKRGTSKQLSKCKQNVQLGNNQIHLVKKDY